MNISKNLAFDMCIEPIRPTKWPNFRERQYDENDNDEEIQSSEKSFRTDHFFIVVDMGITSLKNIFEKLEVIENIFGLLFDARMMQSLDSDEVKKSQILRIYRMPMQIAFFMN